MAVEQFVCDDENQQDATRRPTPSRIEELGSREACRSFSFLSRMIALQQHSRVVPLIMLPLVRAKINELGGSKG